MTELGQETANPNRKPLADHLDGDWIVLVETIAYKPVGYQRKKWTRESVCLTHRELRKLAEKYLGLKAVTSA